MTPFEQLETLPYFSLTYCVVLTFAKVGVFPITGFTTVRSTLLIAVLVSAVDVRVVCTRILPSSKASTVALLPLIVAVTLVANSKLPLGNRLILMS